MPTGIISTIIVGAIIGWLGSIIAKTNDQMGCLWNIIVGIVGAALGHWIASTVFHFNIGRGFSLSGFLFGILGAVLLIMLLKMIGILRR